MRRSEAIQVARKVQACLRRYQRTRDARVAADEVRRESSEGDWWYVPVMFHEDPEHSSRYFDAFSAIEDALRRKEKLEVLLVPRIIPFARWRDIA